jgi:hypothetical protein
VRRIEANEIHKQGNGALMGLFDTIYVEGGNLLASDEYQTKDLDCAMSAFIIREGRLIRINKKYEPNPEEGFPALIEASRTYDDEEFHGDIDVCMYNGKELLYYRVRFTHGQLEKVEVKER